MKKRLGRPAGLAFINVGNREDSELYIRKKQEACEKVNTSLTDYHVHIAALYLNLSSHAEAEDSLGPALDNILQFCFHSLPFRSFSSAAKS